MSWVLSAFADEAGSSCEEQIKALQRAGFAHIDIRGIDGFSIVALPVDKAWEIRRKLDDAGITVNMFGSPIGKIDIADDFETDLKKLRHLGALIEPLGCRAVRLFSYYNKGKLPKDAWQAESMKRLGALRDEAKKLGLVLYHENERHIFGDLCVDVLKLAALRDGQSFKLIFDFDNYNQSGDDVWDNWLKLRDKTDAIHLKDSDKGNQHVPVGQGNGQVRKIMADAMARGWNGPLTLEPHLSHSKAVAATGPSGKANEQYATMSQADSFHVAAQTAKKLLAEVGAVVK
ncbi:MAG: sugar phosphate isomerase/epimerase [Phycisphaeraceae bacterium]